ncbi:MAG: minor capsid protein [Methylocystis sp.]
MNKYEVARIALIFGIARDITLRPIAPSAAFEQELRRIIGKIPASWRRAFRELIMPAYKALKEYLAPRTRTLGVEPPNHHLEKAIAAAAEETARVVLRSTRELDHWTARVEQWTRARMLETLKAGLGKDAGLILFPDDVKHEIAASMQGNIALIRDLDRDARKRLEQIIWQGVLKNHSVSEIETALSKQLGIVGRRAKLIARDQTHKLTADLVRLRHQQMGIVEYAWHTREDDRVRGNPYGRYPKARPSHWAREGTIFRYDQPPEDGNPGEPILCRCVARGVIRLEKEKRRRRFFAEAA